MPFFSLRVLTLAVIALHTTLASTRPVDNSGNSYSGKGGQASGGNVTSTEEKTLVSWLGLTPLVNYDSGNAGHAGEANSGNAFGGGFQSKSGHWSGAGGSNSENAYTQDGGVANGGSVTGARDGLINIKSNNAGQAGAASSGAAVGGGGGGGGGDLKSEHGGERDGGRKNHYGDDNYHGDDDHYDDDHAEDDYQDHESEIHHDGKRHEDHRNNHGCDC